MDMSLQSVYPQRPFFQAALIAFLVFYVPWALLRAIAKGRRRSEVWEAWQESAIAMMPLSLSSIAALLISANVVQRFLFWGGGTRSFAAGLAEGEETLMLGASISALLAAASLLAARARPRTRATAAWRGAVILAAFVVFATATMWPAIIFQRAFAHSITAPLVLAALAAIAAIDVALVAIVKSRDPRPTESAFVLTTVMCACAIGAFVAYVLMNSYAAIAIARDGEATLRAVIQQAGLAGTLGWAAGASLGAGLIFQFREWLNRKTSLRVVSATIASLLLLLVYSFSMLVYDWMSDQATRPPAPRSGYDLRLVTFRHPGLLTKLIPLVAMAIVWLFSTCWREARKHVR